MTGVSILCTTTATEAEARRMAETLVGERLAACVQLVPAHSVYRWKGAVETADECVLWVKTRTDAVARVRDAIRRLHTYETPEIVAWEASDGLDAYLDWVRGSVLPPPAP